MTPRRPYVGRFAPSPTGTPSPGVHGRSRGQLVGRQGPSRKWLIRMEDLDPPREMEGAADDILQNAGGVWFDLGRARGVPKPKTRLVPRSIGILKVARTGLWMRMHEKVSCRLGWNGLEVYPGTCRDGLPEGVAPRSWRFQDAGRRTPGLARRWQGEVSRSRQEWEMLFFVVRTDIGPTTWPWWWTMPTRASPMWSVAPIWWMPLRFIWHCSKRCNANEPLHACAIVVTNDLGQKLSKQTLAQPVEPAHAAPFFATSDAAPG